MSYLGPGHKDVNQRLLVGPRSCHGLVQTVSEVAFPVPGTPHWAGQRKREREVVTFCRIPCRPFEGTEMAPSVTSWPVELTGLRGQCLKGVGFFTTLCHGVRKIQDTWILPPEPSLNPFRQIRASPVPRRPRGCLLQRSPCNVHDSHQQK